MRRSWGDAQQWNSVDGPGLLVVPSVGSSRLCSCNGLIAPYVVIWKCRSFLWSWFSKRRSYTAPSDGFGIRSQQRRSTPPPLSLLPSGSLTSVLLAHWLAAFAVAARKFLKFAYSYPLPIITGVYKSAYFSKARRLPITPNSFRIEKPNLKFEPNDKRNTSTSSRLRKRTAV